METANFGLNSKRADHHWMVQGTQRNQRLLSLLEKTGHKSGRLCHWTYRKYERWYWAGYICKVGSDRTVPVCTAGNLAGNHDSAYQQPGGALSGRADCFSAPSMLNRFITGAEQIFLACGTTDFRKQADSLAAIVSMQFHWILLRINVCFSFVT